MSCSKSNSSSSTDPPPGSTPHKSHPSRDDKKNDDHPNNADLNGDDETCLESPLCVEIDGLSPALAAFCSRLGIKGDELNTKPSIDKIIAYLDQPLSTTDIEIAAEALVEACCDCGLAVSLTALPTFNRLLKMEGKKENDKIVQHAVQGLFSLCWLALPGQLTNDAGPKCMMSTPGLDETLVGLLSSRLKDELTLSKVILIIGEIVAAESIPSSEMQQFLTNIVPPLKIAITTYGEDGSNVGDSADRVLDQLTTRRENDKEKETTP